MNEFEQFDLDLENYVPPKWLPDDCPTFDWVEYKGEKLVAVLDFEASEKRQRPILDLSYCMTTALNDCMYIYKNVLWNPKKFKLDPFNEAHK